MRLSHAVIASLALGLSSVPTLAQGEGAPPPPRGEGGGQPRGGRAAMPQFSPEQLKAAYEAQATHISKANSLSDADTTKVVEAYQSARASQSKALEELRAKIAEQRRAAGGGEGAGGDTGGGGGRGAGGGGAMAEEMAKAMADINKTEKEKLVTALNGFLKPEQTEKVAGSLGNFDRTWDQVSVAIADLKLDPAKQDQAMGITQAYSAAVIKARENPDRAAQREANVEARRKMMDEMKAVLDEEAYGKFQRAVGGGTGRGPGGGAEGAPGRRQPGAQGGAGGGRGGGGGQGGGGGR